MPTTMLRPFRRRADKKQQKANGGVDPQTMTSSDTENDTRSDHDHERLPVSAPGNSGDSETEPGVSGVSAGGSCGTKSDEDDDLEYFGWIFIFLIGR